MTQLKQAATPEWLRSVTGLPVCKDGNGGYSDYEVTLFTNDWESENKDLCKDRFWVLSFRQDRPGEWRTSVSAQDGHRHAGTFYMATVRTQDDALRLFAALGIELHEGRDGQ